MKSWTRTLNLDDAHTLLALAEDGRGLGSWSEACHDQLPGLSMARRRELVRMLRDGFLEVRRDGRIRHGLFMQLYRDAAASAQIDLVHVQWALTHPLSVLAAEQLVGPALQDDHPDIPLDDVEALVAAHLSTSSAESRRKTRTVLLGALEGVGVLHTSGTGQHRALRAARAHPHPLTFGYLVRRDLDARDDGVLSHEAACTGSLAARLTQCGEDHAQACLEWNLARGVLVATSSGDLAAPAQEIP